MKFYRTKLFAGILIALLAAGFGYYYRNDAGRILRRFLSQLQPCQQPITYSIANLDSRFGITRTELLNDIEQAAGIWGSPIQKQLFQYSPTGDLKISLVYDYRQQATDALRKLGIVISDDRTTYDTLKAKYDSLVVSYIQQKAELDSRIAKYNTDKAAYDNEVNYWNSHGGITRKEYNALDQERISLNNEATAINQEEDSFNSLVDTINSTEVVLNKLVGTLNLQVKQYNATGSSVGMTFNEGEYVSSANGTAINIFQFDNADQLVRVLAHELGHALGLEHLANPKAIMYYLNEGLNEKLTPDDLAALKNECGIK